MNQLDIQTASFPFPPTSKQPRARTTLYDQKTKRYSGLITRSIRVRSSSGPMVTLELRTTGPVYGRRTRVWSAISAVDLNREGVDQLIENLATMRDTHLPAAEEAVRNHALGKPGAVLMFRGGGKDWRVEDCSLVKPYQSVREHRVQVVPLSALIAAHDRVTEKEKSATWHENNAYRATAWAKSLEQMLDDVAKALGIAGVVEAADAFKCITALCQARETAEAGWARAQQQNADMGESMKRCDETDKATLEALSMAHATIEAWQDASGLERGGDPGGVTPEGMRKYWEGVEAEDAKLRAERDTIAADTLKACLEAVVGLRCSENDPAWDHAICAAEDLIGDLEAKP